MINNEDNYDTATTSPSAIVAPGDRPAAIRLRGLSRRFGNAWAVKDLTFDVPQGAICGFLGLNGAGKTTVLRMLYGLLDPTSGTACVAGVDPIARPVDVRHRVGYVIDSPHFYEWMTAAETLSFVGHHRAAHWDSDYALGLLDLFGVPRHQPIRQLSKGQRAKVSLVLGLGFRPEVLLLDEPTLGLDPVARRQFVEGVLGEFSGDGRTVLISSHQISEIAGLVDHVVVIHEGVLVCNEPTEQLLGRMRRLRLGFAGPAPDSLPVPAEGGGLKVVSWKATGHEAECIIAQFDPAGIPDFRVAVGAQRVLDEPLGLEEAFVHLVGGWRGVES